MIEDHDKQAGATNLPLLALAFNEGRKLLYPSPPFVYDAHPYSVKQFAIAGVPTPPRLGPWS